MEYCIDYFPNQDAMGVNLNKKLINGDTFYSEFNKGEKPKLAADLLEINGIIKVTIEKYSVSIYKASVFPWDDLLPHILSAIQINSTEEGEAFKEAKPPVYYPPAEMRSESVTVELLEKILSELGVMRQQNALLLRKLDCKK